MNATKAILKEANRSGFILAVTYSNYLSNPTQENADAYNRASGVSAAISNALDRIAEHVTTTDEKEKHLREALREAFFAGWREMTSEPYAPKIM
ncbi:MAG: hypothetical protein WC962_09615 [Phycisphaerae bacterium]|jgi:hypothetical protein